MKRNTMLIVDDEEVNRAMMLIRQYRHSMEVVLLDLVMPFEPHVVRRRVQNVVELNRLKPHLAGSASKTAWGRSALSPDIGSP